MIVREAKQFHVALEIPTLRQQLLIDVADEVRDGRLGWSYENVFSLVEPFRKTGVLDNLVDFQDDELVVEDGEPPWAEPGSESDDERASGAEEHEEDEAMESAAGVQALGPTLADEAEPPSNLSPHQADAAIAAAHRLNCLKRALDAITELPEPGDPGLEVTIKRAMHAEERRAFGRQQEHPEVADALQRMQQEERQDLLRQRHAIAERARLAHSAKDLQGEVKNATEKLKQKKAEIESHAAILECKQAAKSYTPEMFGQGKKNGGDNKHRKERFDAWIDLRSGRRSAPNRGMTGSCLSLIGTRTKAKSMATIGAKSLQSCCKRFSAHSRMETPQLFPNGCNKRHGCDCRTFCFYESDRLNTLGLLCFACPSPPRPRRRTKEPRQTS